jgi:MFS family permease
VEGNIRVLVVQTLVSQLGFGMFYVVWQPYLLATGISVVWLGIIQSVINLSTAAGLIAWGVLSDRYGRKSVILVSNVFRMLALVALIVSGQVIFLLLFAFLIGFSSLFMQGNPARSALIAESVVDGRRASAFSILLSVSQMTNVLTASAGGYIATTVGYHPIFYLCVAGDLAGVLVLARYLKETYVPSPGRRTSIVTRLRAYILPEREVWRLYLILLVMGLGYGTGYSIFYGTLVDSYGFTPIQLGLMSTAFSLTWGLSSIPLGRLSERVGYKPVLLGAWACAMLSVIGYLAFRSFATFLLFNVISALDPALWIPAWMALIADNTPSARRSMIMGKIDAFSRFSSTPAPWIGGLLYATYGFAAPLTMHLLCLTLSGVLVYSLKDA